MYKVIFPVLLLTLFCALSGCTQQQKPFSERPENREVKQQLQGIWLNADTEIAVFRMKGDTVYYADSLSMPAYFKVVEDSLFIGKTGHYHIEKHTAHVLWFKSQFDETVKLVRDDDDEEDDSPEFTRPKSQILTLTTVLKRDTVVFYDNTRYHIYIAINPTKYKVSHHTLNDDGLDVENVYYDNIIHLSIFKGTAQIFSRDFRKALYTKKVPDQVLQQAILNNMEFDKADDKGFHFRTSVCIPEEASCYMVGHTISYKGQLTTQLLEY